MMWLFCDLREQARGGKIFVLWQELWSNRKKERKIEFEKSLLLGWMETICCCWKKEIFDLDSVCFFSTTFALFTSRLCDTQIDITMTWKMIILLCLLLLMMTLKLAAGGNFIYENLFCVDVVITLICIFIKVIIAF